MADNIEGTVNYSAVADETKTLDRVFLNDLGSSNGTFMKVNGERAVGHDSFVLLGQQLFRLNFG